MSHESNNQAEQEAEEVPSGVSPTEDSLEQADNTVSDWAAYIAMTCALVAFLPSSYRIWKRKTSCDVSLFAISLRVLAAGFWLYYAVSNAFVPNMVSSSLSLAFTLIFLSMVFFYRKGCDPEFTWNAKLSEAVHGPAQAYPRLVPVPSNAAPAAPSLWSQFQGAQVRAAAL